MWCAPGDVFGWWWQPFGLWLLLGGFVLLSLHVFVGLVGADVDERGDVSDGEGAGAKGKTGKALSLVETGLKAVAAFTGKGGKGADDEADGQDDKKPGKFDLIATGLKVVSVAKEVAQGSD
ncbi:MAG: hypothetical protein ACRER3_25755, partial [Pseudomonas fluorescens]